MKCFILLLLVAFAVAVPVTNTAKRVTIDEDGTITVLSGTGKKIVISKAIGHPGPKDIEISLDEPNAPKKVIKIDGETQAKEINLMDAETYYKDEDREKRSSKDTKDSKNTKSKYQKSESEVLSQIFKEYEGAVDEKSYNNLLVKINNAVQAGELNPTVYNVLNSLNQYKEAEKYGYQMPYVNREYPTMYQGGMRSYPQFINYEQEKEYMRQFYPGQVYPQYPGQIYPGQVYTGQYYPENVYSGQYYKDYRFPTSEQQMIYEQARLHPVEVDQRMNPWSSVVERFPYPMNY